MNRTTLSNLAVAVLLMAANAPAAGQSGLYDFPGEYAGRFDGVSQKGGVGANESPTVGSNRKAGRLKNTTEGQKGSNSTWVRMSQPRAGGSSEFDS